MENEQPELIARSRKSKTPLIIGIVVAIHVVLIGSAFIIQEIHKRGRAPEQQAAVETEATPNRTDLASPATQPIPDPVTMAPEAKESSAQEPKGLEAASLAPVEKKTGAGVTAPERKGDLTLPAPVGKKAVAKVETPAAKARPVAKTYTIKKGDTWKSVSARLKVPIQELAKDNKLDSKKFLKIGQKLAYKQATQAKTTEVAAAAPKAEAQSTVVATQNMEKAGEQPAAVSEGPTPAKLAVTAPGPFVLYEVKKGDTLGSIAMRHAMKTAELRTANDLKNDRIVVGQKLKVQQPGPKPAVQSLVADVEPRDSAPQIHVVSKGETISELARRYGITTSELLKANNINDPTKVSVGQKLKIPSLEFPGSRAEMRQVSSDQETMKPTVEGATKI